MSPEDFIQMLDRAPGRMESQNYSDPLETASYEVGEIIGENFITMEGPNGESWPPRRSGGTHPLLRLTWDMYSAATDPDNPKAKKLIEPRQITFGIDGNEIDYGRYHNYGIGQRQRQFFYVPQDKVPRVQHILASEVRPIVLRQILGRF